METRRLGDSALQYYQLESSKAWTLFQACLPASVAGFFSKARPRVSTELTMPLFGAQLPGLDLDLQRAGSPLQPLRSGPCLTRNRPSRLRWSGQPFGPAAHSCLHTGCDLTHTARHFSLLLNVAAAAAALPLCPLRVPLPGPALPGDAPRRPCQGRTGGPGAAARDQGPALV